MTTDVIECDCCGGVAARGICEDGQKLLCGCDGQISLDSETPPYCVIFDDGQCPVTAECEGAYND